jgi:acetolactate decarboxylase
MATSPPSAAFHRRARLPALPGLLVLACVLALGACRDASARSAPPQAAPSPLVQWSPFIALQNGVYEGFPTVGQVKRSGNLGLAAAARLNGEMLLVGDTFFQFLANGHVARAPDTLHLAFALAAPWRGGTPATLPAPVVYPFPASVDRVFPTVNAFYSLHAHGRFACIVVRTFPRQAVDTPIAYVRPRIDTLRNVSGTLGGFREPPFVSLTSIPGYHLHFIDDAHDRGGHVLAFTTTGPLVLSHATLAGLQLFTPSSLAYRGASLEAPRGPPPPAAGCP